MKETSPSFRLQVFSKRIAGVNLGLTVQDFLYSSKYSKQFHKCSLLSLQYPSPENQPWYLCLVNGNSPIRWGKCFPTSLGVHRAGLQGFADFSGRPDLNSLEWPFLKVPVICKAPGILWALISTQLDVAIDIKSTELQLKISTVVLDHL